MLNGGDYFTPPTSQVASSSKKTTKAAAKLSEEERDRIREENYDVRAIVFRDIRRPDRNYDTLLNSWSPDDAWKRL